MRTKVAHSIALPSGYEGDIVFVHARLSPQGGRPVGFRVGSSGDTLADHNVSAGSSILMYVQYCRMYVLYRFIFGWR